MPTKRTRRPRRGIDQAVPLWAERLLAGELPERDGDGWDGWFGWPYLADEVPGLPAAMCRGRRLWAGRLL